MLNNRQKHHISMKDIAEWFGYSSEMSFRNSSANKRIISGIDKVIKAVEDSIIDKIK